MMYCHRFESATQWSSSPGFDSKTCFLCRRHHLCTVKGAQQNYGSQDGNTDGLVIAFEHGESFLQSGGCLGRRFRSAGRYGRLRALPHRDPAIRTELYAVLDFGSTILTKRHFYFSQLLNFMCHLPLLGEV